jgi:type II secretory pathway component GspD/PulD (secretin)
MNARIRNVFWKVCFASLAPLVATVSISCGATNDTRTAGILDFQNTPVVAVIDFLANILLDKPVIVSPNMMIGSVTYRSSHALSIKEAVAALSGLLRTNGRALVDVDSRYYRLCSLRETNQPPDRAHVEIAIEKNQLTVDTEPVPVADIVAATQKRLTPASEIWIYDARNSTNMSFHTLVSMLNNACVASRGIFIAFVPKH